MPSLKDLIQHRKPISTGAMATYELDPVLKETFATVSRFGDPIKMYRVVGNTIQVPRAVCPLGHKDLRVAGPDIEFPNLKFKARKKEQEEFVTQCTDLLLDGQSFVARAYTGFGKCKDPEEPVLMYDGSIKKVKDIKIGDQVMGPDSTPRNVLQVNPGRGPMYKVIPNKGKSWKCNDAHILSLKCTSDNFYGKKDEVVNVRLDEWLKWPNSKKHIYKLWRVGVDFPSIKSPELDPYFMGVLLGDGSIKSKIGVTTMDESIVSLVYDQAKKFGLNVRVEPAGGKSSTYYLTQPGGKSGGVPHGNRIKSALHRMGLRNDKFIPKQYKVGTRDIRLNVLSGLLDTDGHLVANTVFEFVSKYKQLSEDVAFVSRSLGLAAYVKEVTKECVNTGTWGTYWRVHISGNTDVIPTRLKHKKANPRKQKKDVLKVGFDVEPLGDGDYFGIVLDGDHLYLLDDFTVTHNTACSMPIIAKVGKPTLVVVTKDDLIGRWKEDLIGILGLDPSEIGFVRQDSFDVAGKKVVIGMVHSLIIPGRYPSWLKKAFGLVIFDEVHRLGADSFSKAARMFNSKLRLGLTATPTRKDGKDIIFHANIGPLRVKTTEVTLKPKVLRYMSNWQCPLVTKKNKSGTTTVVKLPHAPGKDMHIRKILAKNTARNAMLADLVYSAYKKDRNIVFFSDLTDHLTVMRLALIKRGVKMNDIAFYVGGMNEKQREAASVKSVILTTFKMMSEGTNIPWLDTMVLGLPRSDVEQIAGRILREYEDKKFPVVFDIVDNDSHVFKGYGTSRIRWYKKIGAKVVNMSWNP